jgi:hypothetical protein
MDMTRLRLKTGSSYLDCQSLFGESAQVFYNFSFGRKGLTLLHVMLAMTKRDDPLTRCCVTREKNEQLANAKNMFLGSGICRRNEPDRL